MVRLGSGFFRFARTRPGLALHPALLRCAIRRPIHPSRRAPVRCIAIHAGECRRMRLCERSLTHFLNGRTSGDVVTNRHSNVHVPDRARTQHEIDTPQARRPSPTTDSSPSLPVPPPVGCRPNPTTPSQPSTHGRSRCAPCANARWRSRSRSRARGVRSGDDGVGRRGLLPPRGTDGHTPYHSTVVLVPEGEATILVLRVRPLGFLRTLRPAIQAHELLHVLRCAVEPDVEEVGFVLGSGDASAGGARVSFNRARASPRAVPAP